MPQYPIWLNKKSLGAAVLCAGGAALLLHPACLLTLGLGAWLGCRGKERLDRYLDK